MYDHRVSQIWHPVTNDKGASSISIPHFLNNVLGVPLTSPHTVHVVIQPTYGGNFLLSANKPCTPEEGGRGHKYSSFPRFGKKKMKMEERKEV
jgi:hypothetical protein